MIAIPFSKSERSLLIKEILAKGGAFIVLVCWVIYMSIQNNILSEKIDRIETQMYELQNNIIRENTKTLHEFNIKTK